MAIDSPLLRQLRQREQENLRIAAQLKQKRLKIEAEIAEIESETEALRSETWKLRAWNAKLLSMLCDALASTSTTIDQRSVPTL
ncbi:hypothetical protein KBY57_13565 [Cyanobium sp. Aljojuca 7D2]|uniref:hypothetical protein n=1 Tax=Cyanobium sp. Aljojuca 7D2 TaxID=2823698 RepID=UPI0020CED4A4|nr:hypothetical protein [Cyanobium sp. Aljojuca 7D2]MCP9892072.1 hypothetical protein [Cyanobium sp. Aljojuca 7D2]